MQSPRDFNYWKQAEEIGASKQREADRSLMLAVISGEKELKLIESIRNKIVREQTYQMAGIAHDLRTNFPKRYVKLRLELLDDAIQIEEELNRAEEVMKLAGVPQEIIERDLLTFLGFFTGKYTKILTVTRDADSMIATKPETITIKAPGQLVYGQGDPAPKEGMEIDTPADPEPVEEVIEE